MKYTLYKVQRGWMLVPNGSCVNWDNKIGEFVIFTSLRQFSDWATHKKRGNPSRITPSQLREVTQIIPKQEICNN